jgi:uncharacterized membrane protein YgcG
MMKQACPLCAMAQKKFNTGKESDKKRGYELRAKMRIYAAIVDRADEDKGVQTFPFGQQIFEQLTNIRDDGDFTHPTEGFDITIFRKGTGQKDTEYDVKPSRKESPMHEDAAMMDEWFEQLPDLLSNAHVPSTQEVVDKIQEAADRADEEAGSDNGSDRRQRGRSSAGGGGRSSSGGGRGADESAAAGPRERRASTVSDDTDFVDTDGEDVDGEGAAVEGEEGQEDLWR